MQTPRGISQGGSGDLEKGGKLEDFSGLFFVAPSILGE